MHFKPLAILSLSALTLASPIAQDVASGSATVALPGVPMSILTVLETAIPSTWYQEMLNPASRDSVKSEIQAGTLPAWYNSLPASVKAWATSAAGEIVDSLYGATATATATGSSTATVTATAGGNAGNDGTHAVAATPVAPAATTSGSKDETTKTSSGSSASETAASTSQSSTPSSSTSTGGAPIATGVAMSFAGAAGLLGLALAL